MEFLIYLLVTFNDVSSSPIKQTIVLDKYPNMFICEKILETYKKVESFQYGVCVDSTELKEHNEYTQLKF